MALEDNAKKRIEYIAKRQELLASAVNSLQASLYESVLKNFDKIADDPAKLDQLFREFQASKHAKVIQTFAVDIMQIGRMNAEYFEEIAADLDSKDYADIKKNANEYLMNRFGLSSNGKAAKDGFLDTFVKDQSILRELKQYGYKSQASGIGVEEFKQGFKDIIVGTEAKNGSLMRYYQTFAFDTYQQADATIQDFYAKKLELEAALYLGGEITGTRPFCHERNGKVFLRSEIETWRGLKFAGKPANYDPFQDRGGYNCRHHFNWITNKQAMRRRSDLEIGQDGELRVKGSGSGVKPAENVPIAINPETGQLQAFKPAANIEDAVQFAQKQGFAKEVNFGKATIGQANEINKTLFDIHSKYNLSELDKISIEAPRRGGLSKTAGAHYEVDIKNTKGTILLNEAQLKKQLPFDYLEKNQADLDRFLKAKEEKPELFNSNTTAARKNRKILSELEDSVKFKRWTLSSEQSESAYKYSMIHEYGHKVHDDIFGMYSVKGRKMANLVDEQEARNLNSELGSLHRLSKSNGDVYNISAYANSDPREFFAESFSMYETEPEKLPNNVKTFIEKVLKYARK